MGVHYVRRTSQNSAIALPFWVLLLAGPFILVMCAAVTVITLLALIVVAVAKLAYFVWSRINATV